MPSCSARALASVFPACGISAGGGPGSPERQAPARCQTTAPPSSRQRRKLAHRDISARLGWLQGRRNASLRSDAVNTLLCRWRNFRRAKRRGGGQQTSRCTLRSIRLAKKNRRPVKGGGLVAEGTKVPLFQFYQSTCMRMPKPLMVAPSKPLSFPGGRSGLLMADARSDSR